jgi:hypothetical protein
MSTNTLAYPHGNKRDLRIDFLRGTIMVYVLIVHFEYFSIFGIFAWDRLAIVSSAEGFVFLSGMVVGMVYKRRQEQHGWMDASRSLWRRAFKLYQVNVYMILGILLLGLLPFVNLFEVTHWTSPWSKESFPLFPAPGTGLTEIIWHTLLLRIGPHQYQIIGLYVVLLALAPLALYLLARGKWLWLVLLCWLLYVINTWYHLRITGARYEMAFPTLTWQLLFFHGMVIGYYREKVMGYIINPNGRWMVYLSLVLIVAFFLYGANNHGSLFWPWGHLDWIDHGTYQFIYHKFFNKTFLGLGRVLNNVVLFVVAYYLLTNYWSLLHRWFGWLFIPLGQNSLYVFTLHVLLIIIVSNTPFHEMDDFAVKSLLHLTIIMFTWLMVKRQVLFSVIPR